MVVTSLVALVHMLAHYPAPPKAVEDAMHHGYHCWLEVKYSLNASKTGTNVTGTEWLCRR